MNVRPLMLLTALTLIGLSAASAEPPPAYQHIAQEAQVPAQILFQVAQSHSHRQLSTGPAQPWPWVISIDGRSEHYASRHAAHQALTQHLPTDAVIKIGLMQLDYAAYQRQVAHHPHALLDPWLNLRLGASELQRHYRQSGRWSLAAAHTNGTLNAPPLVIRVRWPQRQAYAKLIAAEAQRHQLPPALIDAVIATESQFNAQAVSPAGAQGLMQLMPATAKRFGVADPFDPAANIAGGSQYLRWLFDEFHDLHLALAGYNAGENAVRRYGKRMPPYRETQAYVPRVMAYYRLFLTVGDHDARR